jgi:hypothetical protein
MNNKEMESTSSTKARYHYWQAFILSLYSPKLYVDVAQRWRGFGLNYLLLLVALLCIPFSIRFIANFNIYFTDKVEILFVYYPQFIFKMVRFNLINPCHI